MTDDHPGIDYQGNLQSLTLPGEFIELAIDCLVIGAFHSPT